MALFWGRRGGKTRFVTVMTAGVRAALHAPEHRRLAVFRRTVRRLEPEAPTYYTELLWRNFYERFVTERLALPPDMRPPL